MTSPTFILVVTLVIVGLMAFADSFLPTAGTFDALASLSFSVCAFAWVKADARARQIVTPPGSAVLAALAIPIGLPVYLVRALGARRGALATAKAFGFMVVVVLTYLTVLYTIELLR